MPHPERPGELMRVVATAAAIRPRRFPLDLEQTAHLRWWPYVLEEARTSGDCIAPWR